jgi:hypothetical protein
MHIRMLLSMRTTIRIKDDLLKEVKKYALETGKSMTSIIEDSLRESLSRKRSPKKKRIDLPTFKGIGFLPGIDPDDSASLLDLMEKSDEAF